MHYNYKEAKSVNTLSREYTALTDDEKSAQAKRSVWNIASLVKICKMYRNILLWWEKYRCWGGPVSSRCWWVSFWAVTVAAVGSRMAYITSPNMVIWDEAHFGKMVGFYLNGTFFFDVHPSGGKLLLTLFGWLSGYNGTHPFTRPGESYEGYPEIMFIRAGCSLLGAALAPMAFCCAWTITRRLPAAVLASVMIIAEIGTLSLTKFILLDSPLMFFGMASLLGLCRLHYATQTKGPFSVSWWRCLFTTGLMLGCVVSVKFVGLFMVALVGLFTVSSLWELFAFATWVDLLYHLIARVACLIVLPISIYLTCFVLHDALLHSNEPKYDPGEFHLSHFTPGFQMNIAQTAMSNLTQPEDVTYGANVTLRSITRGGGFLSTMNITFPRTIDPKKKQVVFAGRTKSTLNQIQLRYPDDDPDTPDGYYSGLPETVQDGDVVRIYNIAYNKYIFCNQSAAFGAKKHSLIYGDELTEENRDFGSHMWQVHIVEPGSENKERNIVLEESEGTLIKWKVLESHVTLLNVRHKCYLSASGEKLPKTWGLHQPEISCGKSDYGSHSRWYVEQASDRYVPNVTFTHLRTGLLSRFLETQRMMTWMNAQYKPSPSELYNAHAPWMWPLCYRSHPWYEDGFRIILLGNPIVFWFNILGFAATIVFLALTAFKKRRNPKIKLDKELTTLTFWCRWLLLAYLLHYVPFYTMERILYYHHYFPALQISSLLTGVLVGTMVCRFPGGLSLATMTTLIITLAYSFWLFSFSGYGEYTEEKYFAHNSTHKHLRWLEGWQLL